MIRSRFFRSIRTLAFASFVLFVLVYFFLIGIKNIFSYYMFQVEYNNLIQQYTKEKYKNEQFKETLTNLGLIDFWELDARKRLGFIKKDEVVYRFYDDN